MDEDDLLARPAKGLIGRDRNWSSSLQMMMIMMMN